MADDLSRRLAGLTRSSASCCCVACAKRGWRFLERRRARPSHSPPHRFFALDPGPSPICRIDVSDRPVGVQPLLLLRGGLQVPGRGYDLLIETARFGDRHGFAAVWTPERHFRGSAASIRTPAVLGAHSRGATERIGIRAGSVVLPLHHPLPRRRGVGRGRQRLPRPGGRLLRLGLAPHGLRAAAGGLPRPQGGDVEGIETVRRLWRGEAVRQTGVDGRELDVRVLPRPVQAEIPIWVRLDEPRHLVAAGEIGANVLTIVQPLPPWPTASPATARAAPRPGSIPRGATSLMVTPTWRTTRRRRGRPCAGR